MNDVISTSHPTQAWIHLDHLSHNMRLLQEQVGVRPLWPAIKANAYGHGAGIVARHLLSLGYSTLCVAHAPEAIELIEQGLRARFLVLSASLPETADEVVRHDLEPVVCTLEHARGLDAAARKAGKRIGIHVKVDTGMGRVGIAPREAPGFLAECERLSHLRVKGVMSHFPRADEHDKAFSEQQIALMEKVKASLPAGGLLFHMANSAAILDLPGGHFDVARPGISIYGLKPSQTLRNPRVAGLKPVLSWRTRITFLKDVPAGVGLSYGHVYRTVRPSLIATVPLGYGDGLSRSLSNRIELLVRGRRCPQVGRICMDQCLVDVTALRGQVELGDEVVLIGCQGGEELTADELAGKLGTINYEVVTSIAGRVPRVARGA